MRFHELLNQRLHYLSKYPTDSYGYDIQVPPELLEQAKREFLMTLEKWNKERRRQAILEEIDNNRLEMHLRRMLFKVKTLRPDIYEDRNPVTKLCVLLARHIGRNFPLDIERMSLLLGEMAEDEETEILFNELDLHRVTDYDGFGGLEYATHNHLCLWTGEKWVITSLGSIYMALPPLLQIALLLKIEFLLATVDIDLSKASVWHMPRSLIQKLVEDTEFHFALDEFNEIEKFDPVLAYTSRLEDMGLLWTENVSEQFWELTDPPDIPVFHVADDHFEIRMTKLGLLILPEVISSTTDWLSGLIEIGLHAIYDQARALSLDLDSLVSALEKELSLNPAFAEQYNVLQSVIKDLRSGISKAVVLRALQPSVEKLLKNILRLENHISAQRIQRLTLAPTLDIYEALSRNGAPILTDERIRYIRILDRNGILHGSLNPEERMAAILVSLTLSVIVGISTEYRTYKGIATS